MLQDEEYDFVDKEDLESHSESEDGELPIRQQQQKEQHGGYFGGTAASADPYEYNEPNAHGQSQRGGSQYEDAHAPGGDLDATYMVDDQPPAAAAAEVTAVNTTKKNIKENGVSVRNPHYIKPGGNPPDTMGITGTEEEVRAAITIQTGFRGHQARQERRALEAVQTIPAMMGQQSPGDQPIPAPHLSPAALSLSLEEQIVQHNREVDAAMLVQRAFRRWRMENGSVQRPKRPPRRLISRLMSLLDGDDDAGATELDAGAEVKVHIARHSFDPKASSRGVGGIAGSDMKVRFRRRDFVVVREKKPFSADGKPHQKGWWRVQVCETKQEGVAPSEPFTVNGLKKVTCMLCIQYIYTPPPQSLFSGFFFFLFSYYTFIFFYSWLCLFLIQWHFFYTFKTDHHCHCHCHCHCFFPRHKIGWAEYMVVVHSAVRS